VLAETRGEGGFVVVAPSYGKVHETGLPWFVLEGGPATVATVTPDEREAFLDLFRALGVRKPPRGEEKAAPPASLVTGSTGDGTRPGDDYNLRASWDDLLIPAGWTKVYTTRDGVTHWRRPGKSEGTSATTGYGERGNLYLFTTSSDVFEAETSYSKFAAYALLHHHGDYAAAARALAAEGYGSPIEPSNPLVQAPHTDLAPTPVTEATEGQTEGTVDNREAEDSTWKPVNLTPYWRGTVTRPEAGVIHRADGPGLLYPGRVHSFYGESESGKSWLAQIAVATTLTNGGRAVYIDFEADADDIVSRLKLLGIREEHAANLTYLRPEAARSITDPYWQALLDTPTTLIVIDGVTEALTMWGGETKDNDTITTWTRKFPRALARATGAAVVTIDHVPKDKESRGRFAIGGQAKLASIDGCAYLIEPLEPLAPGKVGRLTVRVTKDRPGSIRAVAGMWRKMDRTQEATVAVLDASLTPIAYTFERPRTEEEVAQIKRDTLDHDIMRVILDKPGCGLNVINAEVTGDKRAHKVAIRDLIDSGYLVDEGTGVHGTPWILYPTRRGQEEFGNGQMVMRDVM